MILLLSQATPASAGRFSLGAYGGFSTYTLKDANEIIDSLNEDVGASLLDNVKSGFNYGFEGSYAVNEEVSLGLGYGRLNGSSSFTDPGGTFEFNLPASTYEAFIHFVPANGRKVRFGAGASSGLVRSSASTVVAETGLPSEKMKFKGSGFMFAGYFVMDADLSSKLKLFGQAGFRYANISELEVNDQVVFVGEGASDKFTLDYNGFFLRVGLKLNI
jgi:hypothetical protein